MRPRLLSRGCVLAFLAVVARPVSAEPYQLSTLEWPPYVMADGSGSSPETVRAAFAKAGRSIKISLFSWNRAVKLAADDPDWIGVFPAYYSLDADAEKGGARCLFSAPIGTSPVGFVQRRDAPLSWHDLNDLKPYRIGVVRGYKNDETFDAMVARGEIRVDETENDSQNILRTVSGRTAASVIDKHVFEYLKRTDPRIAEVADELLFNERLLHRHLMYVCFANTEAGHRARDEFNSGL